MGLSGKKRETLLCLIGYVLFVELLLFFWTTGKPILLDTNGQIPALQKGGELRVLVHPGMGSWWKGRDQTPRGIEVELVKAFANEYGWTVRWLHAPTKHSVFDRLSKSHAHLAVGGLVLDDWRSNQMFIGPSYAQVSAQVVCHHRLANFPREPQDFQNVQLHVEQDSAFAHTVSKWASERDLRVNLNLREGVTLNDLMAEVSDKQTDCLVANSNEVNMMQRVYPDLAVAFTFPGQRQLGWYFPKQAETFYKKAVQWGKTQAAKQAIATAKREHFDYVAKFDFVEYQVLKRRIRDRLPKFKPYFLAAERKTGVPADLLAAVAYQESHWDPAAVSPTGVRGIMMITQRTAESLGVQNRVDPWQSIEGGARYLRHRIETQPDSIEGPDRLYFALASYNVGFGHVMDARRLARTMGKNPDSWVDVRKVLPLKSDHRYYRKMRYGYARGNEPVTYVNRIRNYRDVIQYAFKNH